MSGQKKDYLNRIKSEVCTANRDVFQNWSRTDKMFNLKPEHKKGISVMNELHIKFPASKPG